ncbi:GNAT family N-acetyltransferase [Sutterella sp.]|uniref:GNAT family N-acetyltransferase n=1 Tax=Sutterella sp. TaxID=1981025 RepID=UPI0026E060B1|nr:GNAT family N-acetyltransferase [Sutterella sp.]MDO5532778.1 GNAT family N-acetyltransferase [Sutterella sp.]
MEFRKARPSDYADIRALICALVDDALEPDAFARILGQQISDPNRYCLVCEEEGHVLGVLNLRFEQQLHHAARVAEILEFVVSPKLRGRGVGRALLRKAEEVAREAGCVMLEITCGCDRLNAHKLYESEGMKRTKIRFAKSLDESVKTEETNACPL